mmetsp:Transcript_26096/g.73044  ORF Transcript_26096/g.73044 Transcript_26096/m.73044 type:complete len:236 (+) Transcript_26096:58-765(+)
MSAAIKFKPLMGAREETPLCFLLQIDSYTMLLDCGWEDTFDLDSLKMLEAVAPQVDAILLSYPDVPHLGALPRVYGAMGVKAPIFATIPIYEMGQMCLYDIYLSKSMNEDFTLFDLNDIDSAFEHFHQLKYSQRVTLPGSSIDIVPYRAGHVIGGTVWRIVHETDEIVYAMDFNHRQERHLGGFNPADIPPSPALFITDAKGALTQPQPPQKERDGKLTADVMATLRRGGNVLAA